MAEARTVSADITLTGFCKTSAVMVERVEKTTTYTIAATDYYVAVNPSAATTITLPVSGVGVGEAPSGQIFIVADTNGTAGSNNITIVPTNTDTINGSTGGTMINSNWGSLSFISNGVNGYNIY